MVAKHSAAAAAAGELLRQRQAQKYYVALSSRKPSKKMGRVIGDMERSRRGSWKLLRSTNNPATTCFISKALVSAASGAPTTPPLRAFLLKPLTGRTHQIRVALKALGSPILGDPMYASAAETASQDRTYLHAAALRLPAHSALSEDGAPIEVLCPPSSGTAFCNAVFEDAWHNWFGGIELRTDCVWFDDSPVVSNPAQEMGFSIAGSASV